MCPSQEYDDESPGDESPTINGSGTPTDTAAGGSSATHFSALGERKKFVTFKFPNLPVFLCNSYCTAPLHEFW